MTHPFWTDAEHPVYDQLIDHEHDCPWAFRDILLDEGLPVDPPTDVTWARLTDVIGRLLTYCNGELSKNPHLIPAALLRNGRYPSIRQMRDVHQFDVGSHLALAAVLMVRRAPETYLRDRGCPLVASVLSAAGQRAGWLTMQYAAVVHDFLKCFRRRRPLPAKVGAAEEFDISLPDGAALPPGASISEEGIATSVLPHFISEIPVTDVCDIMDASAARGETFYRLLGVPADAVDAYVNEVVRQLMPDAVSMAGLYLSLVDWLAKGYARFVVTKRKKRLRSLEDAVMLFMVAMERRLAQDAEFAAAVLATE